MFKRDLTLMVFSDHSSTPRKLFLSKRLIASLAGSICFFMVLLSFMSYHFYHESVRLKNLSAAMDESKALNTEEVERQKAEIQKIANSVKTFTEDLGEIRELEKKIRVITSLGIKDDNYFGKGGPEDRDFVDMDELIEKDDTKAALTYLSDDIYELKEIAGQQKASLVEIDKYLREQTSILASTPSIWPVKGWVTSGFGYRISPFTGMRTLHEGIDIVAKIGTPVIAPAAGVVTEAAADGAFGNMVEIKHGYGLVSRFGHNSKLLVKIGDKVKRGQVVSRVGTSGRTTGPHLHYELLLNGVPVNPMNYIIN